MAEEVEQPKKKVYVETTVVSDATALPARDVVQLGRQIVTREWWATAAQRRIDALVGIPQWDVSQRELELAHKLVDGKAVPKEFPDDALHIAVAATHAMDLCLGILSISQMDIRFPLLKESARGMAMCVPTSAHRRCFRKEAENDARKTI